MSRTFRANGFRQWFYKMHNDTCRDGDASPYSERDLHQLLSGDKSFWGWTYRSQACKNTQERNTDEPNET